MPRKIPPAIQTLVRLRAGFLCEYCHTNERWQYVRFTMEHVTPVTAEGADDSNNLALACFHCNRRKSNKQSFLDPETGQNAALFHPREHIWSEHFIWSSDGLRIQALTAIGRATVAALELNRERVIRIRAADVSVDRHPPKGDPIQSKQEEN